MTTTSARRPRRSRAEQVAANRRVLLDAAGEVFRELSYGGASIDAIADRAGFTRGAVYSHFDSKADLFLSLLEERIAQRRKEQLDAVAPSDGDPPDLEALFRRVHEISRADPQWHLALFEFRLVAARGPGLNARCAQAHRLAIAGVVETLDELYRRLGARPDLPVEELAVAGFAIDTGTFLEDLAEPGAVTYERAAALFRGVLGLPEQRSGGRPWPVGRRFVNRCSGACSLRWTTTSVASRGDAERIEESQRERLRALLATAIERSPFHRRHLARTGIDPATRRQPNHALARAGHPPGRCHRRPPRHVAADDVARLSERAGAGRRAAFSPTESSTIRCGRHRRASTSA
jgi:AcrR family transcriptional regulator